MIIKHTCKAVKKGSAQASDVKTSWPMYSKYYIVFTGYRNSIFSTNILKSTKILSLRDIFLILTGHKPTPTFIEFPQKIVPDCLLNIEMGYIFTGSICLLHWTREKEKVKPMQYST